MNLIIVESPAKGRTIKKMLGKNYEILASFGHIRDLPKDRLGVDVKNSFEPEYVIPAKARKVIKLLKNAIEKAEKVYLATDYDREGEAIAWHIIKATDLRDSKTKRITFHEITKPAISAALKSPRDIDPDLVDAQQARRILDRLVGYKLSPFLWQKVAQGLSAGRVQTVATRLIVEREREIGNFTPKEYWQIEAILSKKGKSEPFKALLIEKDNKKIEKLSIENQKQAQEILNDLKRADYKVEDIKIEEKKRYPSPPFVTSTLQQEAGRRFGYSAKKTMKIAQDLYEDGLITYMRTDSVQVSPLALAQAKKVIEEEFSSEYSLPTPRFYKTKTRGAQEAHEAIRPTNLSLKAINKDADQSKLYDLIWRKMLASQAKEAVLDETNARIKAGKFVFGATGAFLKFDGFLKIIGKGNGADEKIIGQTLPELKKDEVLDLKNLDKSQHFTEPPPRFTEGTLIRELEKRGIGRPSTYAPTISTIIERGYVEKIQGKLEPKEMGEIVNDLLVEHFPKITDYDFTAKMEENLDEIALGKLEWRQVLSDFYGPFAQNLQEKMKDVSKKAVTEEKTDEKCPDCGKNLKIKLGRYGKFLACSGFPACKFTKPYLARESHPQQKNITKQVEEKCPKCGSNLSLKEGKFGPFLACSAYPKCKFTKNIEISARVNCPNCGAKLLKKNTRKGKTFWGCANFPKCKTAFWDEPQGKKCPKCRSLVTLNHKNKVLKCSQCEWSESV